MTRWVKRPIEVEAIKIVKTGNRDEAEALLDFIDDHPQAFKGWQITGGGWAVWTVDKNYVVVPWGAYCVIDSKGFAYPCDAEIFEANHEAVEK